MEQPTVPVGIQWPNVYPVAGDVGMRPGALPILTPVKLAAGKLYTLPANGNRRGLLVYNFSANPVALAYGDSIDLTSKLTAVIISKTTWVMPLPICTSGISFMLQSGNDGTICLTELMN